MKEPKQHTFTNITAISRQWLLWIFVFLGMHQAVGQEGLQIASRESGTMSIEYNVKNIRTTPRCEQYASVIIPDANCHSCEMGRPMLPMLRKLIALPDGSTAKITIDEEVWDTLELDLMGCHLPLIPYTGAMTKDAEPQPIEADDSYYSSDSLMGAALVDINTIGIMRGTQIAVLSISPVRYNPKRGVIAVCRKLKATLSFTEVSKKADICGNPMLRSLSCEMPDSPNGAKDYVNILAQDTIPQGYLVVSGTRFRKTLQPLLKWKRQEGYIVDELYFDYGDLNSVKDSLQNRYDNPTADHPAPLFILIVGDLDDIALWPPRHNIQGLETHRSDFYYSEFTGDMLPDAMIGRISVRDTSQLRHVVEKTIAYEKGQILDTSAMHRSLLVAGMEEREPAPIVTNGQVNYIKQLLMSHDPAHDTICFYNPSSADRRDDIMDALRSGVGMVNYSSHCTSRGWRNPYLSNNDINDSNIVDGHLFIAVNNCCRSNDVASECFGEMLLRKAGGGAVGTIGASNETLWEEDYYWSVGFGNTTANPSPDSTSAGAFDRLLHPSLQPSGEQAWTLAQMMLAGNSAVVTSGSPYADFYWEIYLLLGDPSLMPHIGPIHPMLLECDSVQLGDTILSLHGTPWARVAAVCGDTLMGLCALNASGDGLIRFRQPVASTICITATRQFHKAKQITYQLTQDNDTLGITTAQKDNITILPNPARDRITVNGIAGSTTLTLYDSMGRTVMRKEISDGQTILLGNLPKGLYTASLANPNGFKTHKLIIR